MKLVKRLILILALTVSATARDKETVIERLTRLGYDQLPKTLNAILGKNEYRLPTELECWFSPALPTVPLKKNACYYYLKAAYATPPSQTAPPGSYSALEPYDGDIDRFEAWVNRYRSIDGFLETAERLKGFEIPTLSLVEETPYSLAMGQRSDLGLSSRFRNLGRFLCDQGFVYEERGEVGRALASYSRVMRLGMRLMDAKDSAIMMLIGNALVHMSGRCVADLAGTHKLSDEQLQAAQRVVQGLPDVYSKITTRYAKEISDQTELFLDKRRLQQWVRYLEPLMRRALERERKKVTNENTDKNSVLRTFDEYGHGLNEAAKELLEGYKKQLNISDDDRKVARQFFRKEMQPEFKRALSMPPVEAEKLYRDREDVIWQEIKKAFPNSIERPDWNDVHSVFKAFEDRQLWENMTEDATQKLVDKWEESIPQNERLPIILRWSFGLQTYSCLSSYGRLGATNQVWKDCMLTKLSLERYFLKHKRIPNSLKALVPDFLKEVPTDPYGGKPLAYKTDGKSWVLYSVGTDREDNGGESIGIMFRRSGADVGMRSFPVSGSHRRRNLAKPLFELHKKGVRSKKEIGTHLKAGGFVIYRGAWINKDVALARQAREKKTRPNRR